MKSRRLRRTTVAISCIAIQLFLIGAAVAGHGACSDCHLRGRTLKNPNVNELCISCHPDNIKDHVLDVVSNIAPPALPLDRENRITCITCHEAHGTSGNPSMLRLEQEKICAPCHRR